MGAPSSDDTWTSKTANFDETITPDSSTPFTCTVLKLAMDLLLRRCHRIQLLKQQECVLNWTRGAPRESSGAQILNQVIHLLKYYFFCKHIRDIVNASTHALSSGGVPVQIHFISNLAKGKDLIEDIWKKIGNDKIFLFSGMMVVTIDHRHSLRFTLESPTSVIVHLPHGDIRTRGHAQFQDLFSRELILLLLRIIHEHKISIVNGQPSPDKLTVKIDAFGISKGPELVIGGINNEGKHIRKEFGEIIYEFLISLM
ncbi:mediator of RNA polymerase II transcription subunit 17 [Gigaspora margarita]|uniref:Mediator of RNA polymerase II transcription subunit 17 n=1 Tax=Gigaspora margarita TaxID=4874 RepID=A0A8H4A2D5_GIGMA|nr:mediator of RNA polymerase II transcription subunit 17 [Gigaspora margarita]